MTVYVDDMRMPAKVGRSQANWSHMMADSREELVAFALQLGLRAAWLQDKRSGVHFDVTDTVRARAIHAGAVPIECGSDQWRAVVDEARQQYSGPDKRPRRTGGTARAHHPSRRGDKNMNANRSWDF